MTTLTFNYAKVRELWLHALAAPDHRQTFAEADDNVPAKAGLWLVKDEGIYLMSNGQPGMPSRKKDAHEDSQHCVFAHGFNPNTKDRMEVWEKAREAVGGDDFVDLIDHETCTEMFQFENGKTVKIIVTENEMRFEVVHMEKTTNPDPEAKWHSRPEVRGGSIVFRITVTKGKDILTAGFVRPTGAWEVAFGELPNFTHKYPSRRKAIIAIQRNYMEDFVKAA